MAVTNYVVYLGDFTGFWGVFFGSFVTVVAFGIVSAVTSPTKEGAFIGRLLAGIACFLFAGLVVSWIVAWGVPVFSSEGMWMWPLGVASAVAAVLLFRMRRSS